MIYLASTSPRRRKILKEQGVVFTTVAPDYEEKNWPKASPAFLVKRHALAKAMSCLSKIKEGMIIGVDTLVYCEKKVIGKPNHYRDAFKILSHLQGRWHTVYTAVALLNVENRRIQKKKIFMEKTKVRLKKLNSKAIANYLKKINFSDKAGAYAIQSKLIIVQEIRGSFSNVIGLPAERLQKELRYLNLL